MTNDCFTGGCHADFQIHRRDGNTPAGAAVRGRLHVQAERTAVHQRLGGPDALRTEAEGGETPRAGAGAGSAACARAVSVAGRDREGRACAGRDRALRAAAVRHCGACPSVCTSVCTSARSGRGPGRHRGPCPGRRPRARSGARAAPRHHRNTRIGSGDAGGPRGVGSNGRCRSSEGRSREARVCEEPDREDRICADQNCEDRSRQGSGQT